MVILAELLIQLAQQPLVKAQAPALSHHQQRFQEWTRWNNGLSTQLSQCAERWPSFDPYDRSNVDLLVTMRLAPDGQLLGDPVVRAGGDDLVVEAEASRPEIAAFLKSCSPYPPTAPSGPALLGSDGSHVLTIRLPLRREEVSEGSD